MKKGWWILIVASVLIAGVLIYSFSKRVCVGCGEPEGTAGNYSCVSDGDCVKDGCCHAKSCISRENSAVCKSIMCTQECEPGTLDCGQGSCKCINKQCAAVMK